MNTVKIKLLHKGASIPEKAHGSDAAYDLRLPEAVMVRQGRQAIPLGFAMELPRGFCAEIQPRSGLSIHGMNGGHDADVMYGLIDEGFRDEVNVLVNNHGLQFALKSGTRIAQMLIRRVEDTEFEECDELGPSDRNGGLGHTGTL